MSTLPGIQRRQVPYDVAMSGDADVVLSGLDPVDVALVHALNSGETDAEAPFDLRGLALEVGTTLVLLEAVEQAGLLLPHHVDADGVSRYSAADAAAVRAGLTLLSVGLPLTELLRIAGVVDRAVKTITDEAIDVFLRFVRDPVLGDVDSETDAAGRLVQAYEQMLPATERLVAHHLRRRLVAGALERIDADERHSDGE